MASPPNPSILQIWITQEIRKILYIFLLPSARNMIWAPVTISVYRKRLGETVDGINEPSPVSESVKTVKKKVFVSDSEEMADEEQDIFRNLRKEE